MRKLSTQSGMQSTNDYRNKVTKTVAPNLYTASSDSTAYNTENILTGGVYGGAKGYVNTYNNLGQLQIQTDPVNIKHSYTYDLYGDILTDTLTNNSVYSYTYDILNRQINKYVAPSASGTKILLKATEYTTVNGSTTVTEKRYFTAADYAQTKYTYNSMNRLSQQDNPDGGVIKKTYYPNGWLQTSSDANGNYTNYRYDAAGNVINIYTPFTVGTYALVKYEYDKLNRVTTETHYTNTVSLDMPGTNSVSYSFSYNLDSYLTEKSSSSGADTVYDNDKVGNVLTETVKISASENRVTNYQYDSMNRTKEKDVTVDCKDISGAGTAGTTLITDKYYYEPNGSGNLLTHTDPNNVTITYGYDDLNRVKSTSVPGIDENGATVTITTSKTYTSPLGNIDTSTDELGKVTKYMYDVYGNLTDVTDPNGGTVHKEYDYAGRVTVKVSAQNYTAGQAITAMNRETYTYDKMDRILTVSEIYIPYGATAFKTVDTQTNVYDFNGNLKKTTDALGNATNNTYNLANMLLTTLDAESASRGLAYTTSNVYDAMGRLTECSYAGGRVMDYVLDQQGNILTEKTNNVVTKTNTYDLLGHVLTSNDANNYNTAFEYNKLGGIRTKMLPGDPSMPPLTIYNLYDRNGRLISQSDGMNHEVVNTYDNQGRVLTKTTRLKDSTTVFIKEINAYDVKGNLIYYTDPNGYKTTNSYNTLGWLLTSSIPVGGVTHKTTNTYDKVGNKLTVTDNYLNNMVQYKYDPLNRLCVTLNQLNIAVETLEYDDLNRQHSSTDALSHTTIYGYDKVGRVTSITTPAMAANIAAGVTRKTYDDAGNLKTVTDADNHTTTYSYNTANYLLSVTSADTGVTNYTPDNMGNILIQKDGNGNPTTYTYNARGQKVTAKDAMNGVESYTYYADGTLHTVKDRNGVTDTYTYDIYGRQLTETAGSETITRDYDNNGNELTMTDSTGTTSRTYDALNRVTTKIAPMGTSTVTFTYKYDIISGLTAGYVAEENTAQGKTVRKVYDKAGRLYQVLDNGAVDATYTYFNDGRQQTVTYPNGAKEEYTYYGDGSVHTLANSLNGTLIDSYNYVYDANGNMTQKLDETGTTIYTYTNMNQLWTVTEPNKVTTYEYDKAGNRMTATITTPASGGNPATTSTAVYGYDTRYRLTSVTTTDPAGQSVASYSYDANGNRISRTSIETKTGTAGTETLGIYIAGTGGNDGFDYELDQYDVFNQLVKSAGGYGQAEYKYNGDGLRASKAASGKTTYFGYEYDRIVMEMNGSAATWNIYGINLVSRSDSSGKMYYLYNGHGDVTRVIRNGAVVEQYHYDAFGNVSVGTGGTGNPYTYAGYYYDAELGLYDCESRVYDPMAARFLQEDSYLNTHKNNGSFSNLVPYGNPYDPLSLNLYVYCRNNPLIYSDPTGHSPGDVHMPDGSIVKASIVNGLTYLPDGSRPPVGAIVETNGGLYQMTSSGGVKVDAIVTTTSGATAGQITNGQTYVNGNRVTNGSVVTISDGTNYMMLNGIGQKVTPTTVNVPITYSAQYTQSTGYITSGGTTYMVGGTRPTEGSVVNTSTGQYLMANGTGVKANLTTATTKDSNIVNYQSTLTVYYPYDTVITAKSTTMLLPINQINPSSNNVTNFVRVWDANRDGYTYGGDQQWYTDLLKLPDKDFTGCGSVAAANLLLYYMSVNYGGIGAGFDASTFDNMTAEQFINFANYLYDQYVRQTIPIPGVNTGIWFISTVTNGVNNYLNDSRSIRLQEHGINNYTKQTYQNAADFVKQGLKSGSPSVLFVRYNDYANSLFNQRIASETHFMTVTGITETTTSKYTPGYTSPYSSISDASLSISTWGNNTEIPSLGQLWNGQWEVGPLKDTNIGNVFISYFTK